MLIIAPGDTSAASAVVLALGAGSLARTSSPSNTLAPQPPPRSPSPSIKEGIGEALAGFKAEIPSTLMQSLRTTKPTPQNHSGAYNQPSPPVYGPTLNQPQFNQSQNPSPFPQQYLPAGYIQRHLATRRILMPGSGEPLSGPGPMHERVMRWHADHPGQRVAAQIHGSSTQPPPSLANPQPAPPAAAGLGQVHSMLLSVNANLQDIENELMEEEAAHAMQLAADLVKGWRRREVFDGVHLPPLPQRRTRAHPATPSPMGDSEALPPSSMTTELPTSEVTERGSDVNEDTLKALTLDAPAHPFAAVPDGSGAGAPKVRNYAYHGTAVSKGTQTAPLQTKVSAMKDPALSLPAKKEPAYKHALGAYDPGALDRVFQRNFDTTANVQLTTAELINISEPARKRLHAMTALSRFPVAMAPQKPTECVKVITKSVTALASTVVEPSNYQQATVEEVLDDYYGAADNTDDNGEGPPAAGEVLETYKIDAVPVFPFADGDPSASEAASDGEDEAPPQGIYRLDPQTFRSGDRAHVPLRVRRATHKLRSIWAVIADAAVPMECVLDPGSQIMAISESKCIELGISWDNKAKMQMVSANNMSNETCRMAHNVPLESALGIVVYLQLHVISHASYDVLLGRPFDMLMATKVVNSTNGNQLITVTCPNSGLSRTIPTFTRGRPPVKRDALPVFPTSMI
ncbi:hypothetical protein L226DRAFT_518791 [Lentinus tigrinus ALCF2SS1-7]|uniref:uncharacterized protein n=1 Tax=Lentinus tigrinus ALCF2SS1-7 TaxID=1328758 RepID=UPI00116622B7|nr:hypothetical protein L226DRAFT_518791 [Lentinus tigrinus ALCF2SS1-7]